MGVKNETLVNYQLFLGPLLVLAVVDLNSLRTLPDLRDFSGFEEALGEGCDLEGFDVSDGGVMGSVLAAVAVFILLGSRLRTVMRAAPFLTDPSRSLLQYLGFVPR